MPTEKYSPLLSVLNSYFCPLSVFINSTVAPTIGFPSTPVAVPPTLARFCAQQLAAPSVTVTATAKIVNVFFMAFLLSQSRFFLLLTAKLFPWRKRLDLPLLPVQRRGSAVHNSRKLRRP